MTAKCGCILCPQGALGSHLTLGRLAQVPLCLCVITSCPCGSSEIRSHPASTCPDFSLLAIHELTPHTGVEVLLVMEPICMENLAERVRLFMEKPLLNEDTTWDGEALDGSYLQQVVRCRWWKTF